MSTSFGMLYVKFMFGIIKMTNFPHKTTADKRGIIKSNIKKHKVKTKAIQSLMRSSKLNI